MVDYNMRLYAALWPCGSGIKERPQVTRAVTGYQSGHRLPERPQVTRAATGYQSGHRLPERPQVTRAVTGYQSGHRLSERPQLTRAATAYQSGHRLPERPQVTRAATGYQGGHRLPERLQVTRAVTGYNVMVSDYTGVVTVGFGFKGQKIITDLWAISGEILVVCSYHWYQSKDDIPWGGGGGAFQKRLQAHKSGNFQFSIRYTSFSVWVRYFVWNFKGNLWNSAQNILPRTSAAISLIYISKHIPV